MLNDQGKMNSGHLGNHIYAKCKMQNAQCKVQNAKCKMQNAKFKMQNVKCKMQSATFKMQNAKMNSNRSEYLGNHRCPWASQIQAATPATIKNNQGF